MKKAKIFLTALSVLAVVGGALAFKAKTLNWFAVCDKAQGICTSLSFQSFATTAQGNIPATFDAYGKPCQIIDGNLTCTTLTRFVN